LTRDAFREFHVDPKLLGLPKLTTKPTNRQTTDIDAQLVERKLLEYRAPKVSPGVRRKNAKWTELALKQLKELLRRGHQVWEIAARLDRSEIAIIRKLQRHEELRALWQPFRSGRFSRDEAKYLIRLRTLGFPLPAMAVYLGRDEEKIKAKIRRESLRIFNRIDGEVFQGPQALTPELEDSIARGRLKDALHDLLRRPMTANWRQLLSQGQAETWLTIISDNIPAQVKRLLASHQAPTLQDLENIPWVQTKSPGVYAWVMRPADTCHFTRECYLYVGSASKPDFGLNGRRGQHISDYVWEHIPRLVSLIRRKKLQRDGTFVTLMTLDSSDVGNGDPMTRRQIVTLAEAIFTELLGGLQETSHAAEHRGLYPWGKESIGWNGCCSHNPLTKDFGQPEPNQPSHEPGAAQSKRTAGAHFSWVTERKKLEDLVYQVARGAVDVPVKINK
jgi:hypothetical protein